MTERRMQDSFI